MRGTRGFTLIELLTVITIIAILAAMLFPLYGRARDAGRASSCLSNMAQIAKAVRMYVNEWDDTYPTNRLNATNELVADIPLAAIDPTSGQPVSPVGRTWVEGLYRYIERVGETKSTESVWKCPSARDMSFPADSPTAASTYAINYNLLERPEAASRLPASTMLLREMDRLCGSVCRGRPSNPTQAVSLQNRPVAAFLTDTDAEMGASIVCKSQLHPPGSQIAFTDGHVKKFPTGLMPPDAQLEWDSVTEQWWNSVSAGRKLIAVNP